MFRLDGKVCIVTGGSRGIGEAIAKGFVESGAQVVIAARKEAELVAAAARLGGDVLAVPCHTGKAEQVRALFDAAVARFGKVDVLVNNAATNPHFGPLLDADDGVIDKTFEVNVKGYLSCIRELVQRLRARKEPGAIVNVASVAGLGAAPLQGVYGMTKAAVSSMTKTLAVELGADKIRVNALAPGLVETRFAGALLGSDEIVKMIHARTPLARHAQPRELAGAAVYLASDEASFVTGATLTVDGGFTIA